MFSQIANVYMWQYLLCAECLYLEMFMPWNMHDVHENMGKLSVCEYVYTWMCMGICTGENVYRSDYLHVVAAFVRGNVYTWRTPLHEEIVISSSVPTQQSHATVNNWRLSYKYGRDCHMNRTVRVLS